MKRAIAVLVCALALNAQSFRDPWQVPPDPQDVVSPLFPASARGLEDLRLRGDLQALRRHAWQLLELVTKPASPGSRVPTWLTWCTRDEALIGCPKQSRSGLRDMAIPKSIAVLGVAAPAVSGAPGAISSQLSTIHFNPASIDRFNQPMLLNAEGCPNPPPLWRVQDSFNCFGPTLKNRPPNETHEIDDFPAGSIAVKLIWLLVPVPPAEFRDVPVWDGILENSANMKDGQLGMWQFKRMRHVAIGPTTVGCGGKPFGAAVSGDIPIEAFFYYPLCTEKERSEADTVLRPVQQLGTPQSAPKTKVGDFLVLVGMHLITKEIRDWVWSTYWWHDRPNETPYGADKPDRLKLSVWGNYRMDATLDASRPIFNPYLELGFPKGALSNCLACHQRAVMPYIAPHSDAGGRLPDGDDFFKNNIRANFLFSIAHKVLN